MRGYLEVLRFHLLRAAGDGLSADGRAELCDAFESLEAELNEVDESYKAACDLIGVASRAAGALAERVEKLGERAQMSERTLDEVLDGDAPGSLPNLRGRVNLVVTREQRLAGVCARLEARLEEADRRAAAESATVVALAALVAQLEARVAGVERRIDEVHEIALDDMIEALIDDDERRDRLAQLFALSTLGERVKAVEERADVLEGWADKQGGFSSY